MRRRRMSAALLLIMSLVSAFLLAACGPKKENTAADMHLIKAEGTVAVEDGSGNEVSLRENLGLFDGYALKTQAASYGWINMDDTKLAKMDAVSRVDIRREGKLLELDVCSGNLFFNVTEPLEADEEMNIRTSNMVAGIRGTCGWVEVPDENSMRVCLLRGKVECTVLDEDGNALTTETITAGESAEMVLEDDEAAIIVAELDEAETPQFVTDALAHPEDWEMGDGDGQDNADAQNGGAARDGGVGADGANAEAKNAEAGAGILQRFPDVPGVYADALKEMDDAGEVLYVETVDFEGDDSPEQLVLHTRDNGNEKLAISVLRDGPQGVSKLLFSVIPDTDQICKLSLVESGGRMYLERTDLSVNTEVHYFEGSIAQRDGTKVSSSGSEREWGTIEYCSTSWGNSSSGYVWRPEMGEFGPDDGGEISGGEYRGILEKYKETEVLAYTPDGGELILLPDPSETELAVFAEPMFRIRAEGSTLYFSGRRVASEDLAAELKHDERGSGWYIPVEEADGTAGEIRADDVTALVFEEGVVQIGRSWRDNVFQNFYYVESVTFPDSLRWIYSGAFEGCQRLTSVTLPPDIESVGGTDGNAFSYSSMESLRAPASLQDTVALWFRYGDPSIIEWY